MDLLADGEKGDLMDHLLWIPECDLRPGDVVMDAGGFRGDWTAEVLRLQPEARVFVYEPVKEFHRGLVGRFASRENVEIENIGLAGNDCERTVMVAGDRSGALYGQGTPEKCLFVDVAEEVGDDEIALLKLNVEGDEYEILERLIESGKIGQIRRLVIQFHHEGIAGAAAMRDAVRAKLEATHQEAWCDLWRWEGWVRK